MKDLLAHHTKKSIYSWENDSEYVQFIIDLAAYIPVEYIDGGPVQNVTDNIITELIELHKKFKFKVDFDGMYLKKPIYFETSQVKYEISSFQKKIPIENDKSHLKFKGYFYIQNSLLVPRELNGIAIRIKNIPIAERFGFDGTFMRYPVYMEQIFRNWISAEIYIEQGLEDAMNIDRKSFRVTHPDYLALQDFVHEYMRDKVFKIAQKLYEAGRNVRQNKREKEKDEKTKQILKTKAITYQTKTSLRDAEAFETPLSVVKKRDGTIIEVDNSQKNKFKKSDWEYLETVFIIFEDVYRKCNGDVEKLRELFYTEIKNWKAKD